MLTTKVFIKKNKIGNYIKSVREHYLRDDIFCGYPVCDVCDNCSAKLSTDHLNKSDVIVKNYILILDTNVILDQIDVLEEDIIKNVIILHTVLQEVRNRSLPTYKRLMSIVENTSRYFYIFTNDHHKDAYTFRNFGEKINDYNDRLIRNACIWYQKHLPQLEFVLLTDDVANRQLAEQNNIITSSMKDYIKHLSNGSLLEDKLAKKDFHQEGGKDIFPQHYTTVEIRDGLKSGALLQGTYKASRYNYLEGFVNTEAYEDPVIVQGRKHINRAVDGDLVAVELLSKDQWTLPTDIVLDDDNQDEDVEITKKTKDGKPTGRVVGVITRKWRQYCGILRPTKFSDGIYQIFVPAERKIPHIRIETRQAEFLRTQKFIVAIDCWPRHSRYPHGHFVRALGKIGDFETENEVVLLEHNVPHSQFSEQVLNCLPKLPWIITDKDVEARVDLRHIDICSVDPPGCTDIDDALHCRPLDNDLLEVGVHIADVSHFIRPGTALDLEAASRATTVYLVNKRIDMVPDLLSSNLCSLRGGEERFAFSVVWTMKKNAQIVATKYHKSIIRSRRAMTYEEAQLTINDESQNDSIANSLRNLNMLAKILKRKRMESGALVLASPEVKIHMDSETLEPIDVQVKQLFETNSMVEEFMLLANISVAEKILDDFPDCAMLRRHPQPPPASFDPLVKAGQHLGFDININSGKELATSLDAAVREDNPYLNTMLRIIATRCMMQAVYFPSGVMQKDEFFHYGLAVPLYTHFTSPIRRYADIIVHRLLAVSVGSDVTYAELLDKNKSNNLCQNLNYRNRMAQYAGRASVAVNTHMFFRGKLKDEESYVLYVRKNALQILIPKYGLECTLYLPEKGEGGAQFEYDEEKQTQSCGDVVLHSFDPVVVRLSLDSNNIQHEKFVLQLVKPFIKGFSVEAAEGAEDSKRKVEESPSKKSKRSKKKH